MYLTKMLACCFDCINFLTYAHNFLIMILGVLPFYTVSCYVWPMAQLMLYHLFFWLFLTWPAVLVFGEMLVFLVSILLLHASIWVKVSYIYIFLVIIMYIQNTFSELLPLICQSRFSHLRMAHVVISGEPLEYQWAYYLRTQTYLFW